MNILETFQNNPAKNQAITATENDLDVIARIREGDIEAFEIIMRRYNQRLYRIARSIVRDDHEAMDVIQDSYIKAYQQLHKFRGPDGFVHWISRITSNEALMHLRRHSRIEYSLDDPKSNSTYNKESTMQQPFTMVSDQQLQQLLEQAIDHLPSDSRSVFVMRTIQQLSTRETALSLDLSEQVVKTRLHRAKKKIRKTFQEHIKRAGQNAHEFAGKRCDYVVVSVLNRILSRL